MIPVAHSPVYNHPLPAGHRFPMEKYELIPLQLIHEGTFEEDEFFEPHEIGEEIIRAVHEVEYLERLKDGRLSRSEERKTGFPWSPALVKREYVITAGTVQAAEKALKSGISFNVAGGTHHAFKDRGEGFCLFNDIAVAANYLLDRNLVDQILVVDLDVHQGNGTASIFSEEKRVFTFSVHGRNNFPAKKEKSDLDISLDNGIGDRQYLEVLETVLPRLISEVRPGFIFYQCGVDILQTDKLGKFGLTKDGCRERDRLVLKTAYRNNIPLTAVMGGGYSPDVRTVVDAHCNTYREAKKIYG